MDIEIKNKDPFQLQLDFNLTPVTIVGVCIVSLAIVLAIRSLKKK